MLRRAWLFFDIDPVRPKDTCATKAEKKAVLLLVKRLLAFLRSLGLARADVCRLGQRCVSALPRRTAEGRQWLGAARPASDGGKVRHARSTHRRDCVRPCSDFPRAGDDKPQGRRHAGASLAAMQTACEGQRRRCVGGTVGSPCRTSTANTGDSGGSGDYGTVPQADSAAESHRQGEGDKAGTGLPCEDGPGHPRSEREQYRVSCRLCACRKFWPVGGRGGSAVCANTATVAYRHGRRRNRPTSWPTPHATPASTRRKSA